MRNPRPRKLTADLSRPFQLQRQHAQPQFRIQRRCSDSSTTEAASGYRQSHPDDHPERRNRRLSRSIRPIYHQTDERIEAHILVAFLAYCLQVTLKQRLRALAPGLTSRSVLDRWRRSRWSMCICRRPTAAPLFCRATPNPSRIRRSCFSDSRSVCPTNRRPELPQTAFRHHNDNPSRGADLVTPHPRKPPTRGGWRLRVAKVGLGD
jgi:hypothetical protein